MYFSYRKQNKENIKPYLIFGILVLNHVDDIAHLEAQLVDVFPDVLVRSFHAIQNTRWQVRCRCTCEWWYEKKKKKPVSTLTYTIGKLYLTKP